MDLTFSRFKTGKASHELLCLLSTWECAAELNTHTVVESYIKSSQWLTNWTFWMSKLKNKNPLIPICSAENNWYWDLVLTRVAALFDSLIESKWEVNKVRIPRRQEVNSQEASVLSALLPRHALCNFSLPCLISKALFAVPKTLPSEAFVSSGTLIDSFWFHIKSFICHLLYGLVCHWQKILSCLYKPVIVTSDVLFMNFKHVRIRPGFISLLDVLSFSI